MNSNICEQTNENERERTNDMCNNANDDDKSNNSSSDNSKDTGGVYINHSGPTFFCLSIIGQIEGHYVLDGTQKTTKYDHVIPQLVMLEESDNVKGILIVLNTMGGDVEAGLAIAEVIASLSKPTVSVVLGGGHSIGVPLAVSARKSYIVPSATMTIHPVRTTGTVISAPQSFDHLRKMQDRIVKFICDHSHVDEKYFREIMMNTHEMANDIGSVIDGNEAVKCGLIDCVGGISDALTSLRQMCEEKDKSNEN